MAERFGKSHSDLSSCPGVSIGLKRSGAHQDGGENGKSAEPAREQKFGSVVSGDMRATLRVFNVGPWISGEVRTLAL